MMNGRRDSAAILGVLVMAAAGYADMIPLSTAVVGRGQSAAVSSSPVLLCADSLNPFNPASITELGAWPIQFLPEQDLQASQPQFPQALTDSASSLRLYLSALMGLGLCGSIHWLKRLHVGFIPEWYHDGGPHQVGHSHALMPNTLCPMPAYCFIQPDCTAQNPIAQYRLGRVFCLWRESQCTPRVLGSHAPPDMSY